ncbi:MAG: hypothetical protein Q8P15_00905, partial [Nanoarchaeota archaeon]|nr:hypothetical protein [Nanoarchaeota archaeon]
ISPYINFFMSPDPDNLTREDIECARNDLYRTRQHFAPLMNLDPSTVEKPSLRETYKWIRRRLKSIKGIERTYQQIVNERELSYEQLNRPVDF